MELVDIDTTRLDEDTNVLLATAKAPPTGDDPDDAPSYDDVPISGQLGVTARPYRKTDDGNAQGVLDDRIPGANGWITSIRDTREFAAKVVEELGEGEVGLHSVAPGFDSRVFCKDQMVALIVGDDAALVIDRKSKRFTFTGFSGHFECSEQAGIVLAHGGASITIANGKIAITAGTVVLGGTTPNPAQCIMLGPIAGQNASPVPMVPAPGVWIGI